MPIALLTIDARGAVTPGNKLARRLFGAYLSGARAEDYAIYGETFAKRLAGEGRGGGESLIPTFGGRGERAPVRSDDLQRTDRQARVRSVQPAPGGMTRSR